MGKSVTHKGIDIFAKSGTPVYSSTPGLVISSGEISSGGNYVFMKANLIIYFNYGNKSAISFTLKPNCID